MKLKHIVGLEEKEFDKDSDGVEICFTERHVRDKGYNTCLNTEVEVDREKIEEYLTNRWQLQTCNGCSKRETCERNNTFCLGYIKQHIATAIETGLVVRVKESK